MWVAFSYTLIFREFRYYGADIFFASTLIPIILYYILYRSHMLSKVKTILVNMGKSVGIILAPTDFLCYKDKVFLVSGNIKLKMCRKVELLDKRMMLGVVVTQIVPQMMQFQQLHQHQIEVDSP